MVMQLKKINYCLPFIDENVIKEVNSCLTETGWLTSGPKVVEFENEIKKLNQSKAVLCVNSWTSGAILMLKWFNIGYGDEVIIPSYTYSATALCVISVGAKPVMVDVKDDFTIDPLKIRKSINSKTKAIIPVDIGGLPCDYKLINSIVNEKKIINKFICNGAKQEKLGRVLVIGDAAHSIGAKYNKQPIGKATDISIFSFHSVKNITTGEGGAISLNLPKNFNHDEEFKFLKILSLNGQTKSAFQKNQVGSWKYDIIEFGLKINMPDICASIGLAQIKIYESKLLPERKKIFQFYDKFFSDKKWAITPISINTSSESSYHLYLLRIKNISEFQRDEMIETISSENVGVNVHYVPMPMLTAFKKMGYKINDYPNTYKLYANEISLPVYNKLSNKMLKVICETVEYAFKKL